MRGATSPRLQLELICARILLPAAYDDEASLLTRLDRLERRSALGDGVPASEMPPIPRPQQMANNSPAQSPRADPQVHSSRVDPQVQSPPARGGDPNSIVQPGQRRGEDERAVVDNSGAESRPGDSASGGPVGAGSAAGDPAGGGSRGTGSAGSPG